MVLIGSPMDARPFAPLADGEGPAGPPPAERDPQDAADERRSSLHDLRATTGWQSDVAGCWPGEA